MRCTEPDCRHYDCQHCGWDTCPDRNVSPGEGDRICAPCSEFADRLRQAMEAAS